MNDIGEIWRRRRYGLIGLVFIVVGSIAAINIGLRLFRIENAWTSNDPLWQGFFVGILFVGIGCVLLWEWRFARPLTEEERHFREVREAWQRERDRLGGG